MKKIVLFDIDRTLIDTDTIKIKRLEAIANAYKIDFNKVEAARQKYLGSLDYKPDYNPYDLMRVLSQELELEYEDIVHTHDNPNIISEQTYEDARLVLETIDKNKFDLGIYSEGWSHYQRYKLSASGLHGYFNEKLIFISRRKKNQEFIESLPRPVIIVDDAISFIRELEKHEGVTPIWLNRKNKTNDKSVETIFSLTELLNII